MRELKADVARYGRHPWLREMALWAVAVYRFGRWNDQQPAGPARRIRHVAYCIGARAAEMLTGIVLPKEAEFGPGLRIKHVGSVVVHPNVRAGANCTLFHGVTLGAVESAKDQAPTLGDDVTVGSHAQILGPVWIGDRVRIGALALVMADVSADGRAFAPRATICQGSATGSVTSARFHSGTGRPESA